MNQLKKYLTINSAFSAISGLTILLFTNRIGDFLGIRSNAILFIMGGGLLIFSVFVWYVSSRQLTNKTLVTAITLLDWLWVLGSFTIVVLGLFNLSKNGYILISIIAVWIAFLAYQQYKNNSNV